MIKAVRFANSTVPVTGALWVEVAVYQAGQEGLDSVGLVGCQLSPEVLHDLAQVGPGSPLVEVVAGRGEDGVDDTAVGGIAFPPQ
ncbi:hypothetical protein ONA70_06520 [Micromonospora yasonensis]|nr:hypothetical protein [Micromonospora yasonensis]MCW3839748.1 hypothetical protein [Micromonospora yasonensis]